MDEVPPVQAEVHGEGDVFCEVEDVEGHLQDWEEGGEASARGKEADSGALNRLVAKVT